MITALTDEFLEVPNGHSVRAQRRPDTLPEHTQRSPTQPAPKPPPLHNPHPLAYQLCATQWRWLFALLCSVLAMVATHQL